MAGAPPPKRLSQPTPAPQQAASGPASPAALSPEPRSLTTQDAGLRRLDRLFSLALLGLSATLLLSTLRPPKVELNWASGSEQGVAAFNLYRQALAEPWGTPQVAVGTGQPGSTAGDADAERLVNPSPIPARGSASQGARYSYRDRDVWWGEHYRYRIEELDLQGRGHFLEESITVAVRDQRPWQWGLGLLTLVWALRSRPRAAG